MLDIEIEEKYKEFNILIEETKKRAEAYHDAMIAAEEQLEAICRERDAWEETIV